MAKVKKSKNWVVLVDDGKLDAVKAAVEALGMPIVNAFPRFDTLITTAADPEFLRRIPGVVDVREEQVVRAL